MIKITTHAAALCKAHNKTHVSLARVVALNKGTFAKPRVSAVATVALSLAAMVTLGACASPPVQTPPETSPPTLAQSPQYWEDKARAAATERWAAITQGDIGKAYTFFTTGSKTGYTEQTLRNHLSGLRARDGKVEAVTCNEDVCEVRVMVNVTIQLPRVGFRQQTVPLIERWIPEDGKIRLIRK